MRFALVCVCVLCVSSFVCVFLLVEIRGLDQLDWCVHVCVLRLFVCVVFVLLVGIRELDLCVNACVFCVCLCVCCAFVCFCMCLLFISKDKRDGVCMCWVVFAFLLFELKRDRLVCLYCVKVSCAYLCVCLLWDKRDGLVCVFFYKLG